MIRTQIQLTEDQAGALRQLAARRGVSLAQPVRQAVERILAESELRERRQWALALLGRFDAGPADVAAHHVSISPRTTCSDGLRGYVGALRCLERTGRTSPGRA